MVGGLFSLRGLFVLFLIILCIERSTEINISRDTMIKKMGEECVRQDKRSGGIHFSI